MASESLPAGFQGSCCLGGLFSRAVLLLWMSPMLTMSSNMDRRDLDDSPSSEWRDSWYQGVAEYTSEVGTNNTITNITVQLGGTAFLHCYVKHFAERGQISWVRRRDWHILSSGMFVYTNDQRFQVLHGESTDDWTLQIKFVQKRDSGPYECQVSTGMGLISHYVNLQIVIPEAFILGSGEHHVDVGSVINLICIIAKSPIPPQYVFWYHNDKMINYDTTRGGITVETVAGPKTQSRLTIRDARVHDSGNYTCSASNTEPASIHVFVAEGSNQMAAILRRNMNAAANAAGATLPFIPLQGLIQFFNFVAR